MCPPDTPSAIISSISPVRSDEKACVFSLSKVCFFFFFLQKMALQSNRTNNIRERRESREIGWIWGGQRTPCRLFPTPSDHLAYHALQPCALVLAPCCLGIEIAWHSLRRVHPYIQRPWKIPRALLPRTPFTLTSTHISQIEAAEKTELWSVRSCISLHIGLSCLSLFLFPSNIVSLSCPPGS